MNDFDFDRLKGDILAEMKALDEAGIRNTSQVFKRVRAGEFDSDIACIEAMKVSEATDLILALSELE